MVDVYDKQDVKRANSKGFRYLIVNSSDEFYIVDTMAECRKNDMVSVQNGKYADIERLSDKNRDNVLGKVKYICKHPK